MERIYLIVIFTILALTATAQTKIKGIITDKKGEAQPFANVAIAGSYDGATANEKGEFNFNTDEKGSKTLIVTMIGFEKFEQAIVLEGADIQLKIKLTETINMLNAVVVTAGMFEASDEKKMVMMKPLDIVTTAGGNADIVSVMQLLPGSNRVGETEGLFVRGGTANETKTLIDGMIVQNPFFSSTPDVPQRGRFNPFMFKGTAFSTGGYSAQYGQALSSVLLLNTQDKLNDNTNTSLSANMAGVGISHTHKGWLTGSVQYTNIAPLLALVKTNLSFDKVPQGLGASVTVNQELKNKAVIKAYGSYTDNQQAINLPNYDKANETYLFGNDNRNIFTNTYYKQTLKDGLWTIQGGASYSRNNDNLTIANTTAGRFDERTQLRLVASRLYGKNKANNWTIGTEAHNIDVSNTFNTNTIALNDKYAALFAETEFYFMPELAFRIGGRGEYSSALDRFNLAPRLSMAYKLNQFAQVSVAAGTFYQNPDKEYMYFNKNLNYEKADHIIANYQIIKDKRTFRTEIFYKKYDNLVKEIGVSFDPNPFRFPNGPAQNTGNGYAQGFDVFFRDQKSLKNGDFWVTYSYLDTERNFRNYPQAMMPHFASKHNASVVYKQFFPKITTNLGLTYTYTSGRPVYAPGENFDTGIKSKSFQNMSLMASKVRQKSGKFTVFYLIVDNILNRQNQFGYRFSPDGQTKTPVYAPINRMIFAGAIITIGKLNGRSREAELDF